MLLLPWHLTDFLADGIGVTVPEDTVDIEGTPSSSTDPWLELVGVYSGLTDAARYDDVTVLAGDCLSAVAVVAGMQQNGLDPAVVWFDAHGDFHTEESTISGYLGECRWRRLSVSATRPSPMRSACHHRPK